MQQSPALWFIHLFCVSSLTIACLGCMSLVLLVGFRKSYGHTISVYVVTTLDVVMPYSGYFVLFVLDIFWMWHLFAYAEYLWHGVITGHVQKLARFCQFGFWNGSMLFAMDKITFGDIFFCGEHLVSYCGLYLPCLASDHAAGIYCLLPLLL